MHDPNAIIDELGGTSAVAQLFNIKPGSVSEWRHTGIPPARLMYLKVVRPDLFKGSTAPAIEDQATAPA